MRKDDYMQKKLMITVLLILVALSLTSCSKNTVIYTDEAFKLYQSFQSGKAFERDYTIKIDRGNYSYYDFLNIYSHSDLVNLGLVLYRYGITELHIKVKGNINLSNATGDLKVYLGFDAPATELAFEGYLLPNKQLYVHKDSLIYLRNLGTTHSELAAFLGFYKRDISELSILIPKLEDIDYIAWDISEQVDAFLLFNNAFQENNQSLYHAILSSGTPLLEDCDISFITSSKDAYTLNLSYSNIFDAIKTLRAHLSKVPDSTLEKSLEPFNQLLNNSGLLPDVTVSNIRESLGLMSDEDLDQYYTFYTMASMMNMNFTATLQQQQLTTTSLFSLDNKALVTLSGIPVSSSLAYTPISSETINKLETSALSSDALTLPYACVSFNEDAPKGYLLNASEYKVVDLLKQNDSFYLPAKAIANQLGISIAWDSMLKTAYTLKQGEKIILQGKVVNNTLFVKSREFEKLGFNVLYEKRDGNIMIKLSEMPWDNELMPLIAPSTGLVLRSGNYIEIDKNEMLELFSKVLTAEDIKLLTTDTDSDYLCDFTELYLYYLDGIHYVLDHHNPDLDEDGLLDGEEFILDLTDLLYTEIDGKKVLTCKPGDVLTFYSSLNNEGYITIDHLE